MTGTSQSRSSSVVACRDTAIAASVWEAKRRSAGTRPTVETHTRRSAKSAPSGCVRIWIACSVARSLSSGSP